jgi:hypothetical protein
VREPPRDLARGHRAAQVHRQQDLAPRRMRDRAAHGLERVELGLRVDGVP